MPNSISRLSFAAMLFLITSALSCASLQIASPPALENRTLRISPAIAGFEYQYEICTKTVLWICTQHEMKKEFWDLNDVVVRQKLIDMGFVASVREKH